MRILVSGASGFLGGALVPALQRSGHDVRALVREGSSHTKGIIWNVGTGALDEEALRSWGGAEGVVHLAGENIASGRWTAERKQRVRSSRVQATERLTATLIKLGTLRAFVGASAVGYYGDRGDEVLTENSAQGIGFLAETAAAWEAAPEPLRSAGVRVAHLRFGMILSADGGALRKMLPLFRLGLGGKIGNGAQWISWITRHDAVRAIEFLLNSNAAAGAFNAVSPEPVRNRDFTHALAKTLHRPAALPVPAFVLRMVFGEMADALLLSSQRVTPQKLWESGFRFEHSQIEEALRACV